MLARYSLFVIVALACIGAAPTAGTSSCAASSSSVTENVGIYIARHDGARAIRAYAEGASAALACAASIHDPKSHRQLVRLAADNYRSAADQVRDNPSPGEQQQRTAARWYAESSHLYRELLGDRGIDPKERDEIRAEIASNDDFASKIVQPNEGVIRDAQDHWAVPVWTSLRRFCHERSALQSTTLSDELTSSKEILFIPAGTPVDRLSEREVKCSDHSLTLARVRIMSGSNAQREGYVVPDDFVAETAAK